MHFSALIFTLSALLDCAFHQRLNIYQCFYKDRVVSRSVQKQHVQRNVQRLRRPVFSAVLSSIKASKGAQILFMSREIQPVIQLVNISLHP